jgi:glycosyltransferase involved in cell wall biosynthesis
MFGLRGLRPDLEISGFETAFSEIAPRLVQRGHEVTIYGRASAHSPSARPATDLGVRLHYMPSPGGKNFSAVIATFFAVLHALLFQRFDVWFFVNVGMGHHCALARLSGRPVVMNVDGLDWTREKWGRVARAYFRSAARAAVRFATRLVTDAEAMRAYYRAHYDVDSTMIAYGADVAGSERPELLSGLALAPRDYYLIVSRLVPENTLEEMLEGYRRSGSRRSLVVVGGATYRDAFHERLRAIAGADSRIRLLGHVHDQALLRELWCNCYAYLHGHSVGGTNPALLRAMGYGSCILARDTVFNREVLADGGRFFAPDAESVRAAVEAIDADPAGADALREMGPARIRAHYSWPQITDQYESLFTALAAR